MQALLYLVNAIELNAKFQHVIEAVHYPNVGLVYFFEVSFNESSGPLGFFP